jgi:hypothetical protein
MEIDLIINCVICMLRTLIFRTDFEIILKIGGKFMNNLCRYVFRDKETGKIVEYVHSLQTIESGRIKALIQENEGLGYDLISRDWWSGLCDWKENKLFYNDELYDSEYECQGIVNYLEETANWVIDWEDDSRDELFDVISDKKRKVCKVRTIYDLSDEVSDVNKKEELK